MVNIYNPIGQPLQLPYVNTSDRRQPHLLILVRLLPTRASQSIAQLNAAQPAQHVRRTTEGSRRGSPAAKDGANLRLRRPCPSQGPRSQRVVQRMSSHTSLHHGAHADTKALGWLQLKILY